MGPNFEPEAGCPLALLIWPVLHDISCFQTNKIMPKRANSVHDYIKFELK